MKRRWIYGVMILIAFAVFPQNVPDSWPKVIRLTNSSPAIAASNNAYSVEVAADSELRNRVILCLMFMTNSLSTSHAKIQTAAKPPKKPGKNDVIQMWPADVLRKSHRQDSELPHSVHRGRNDHPRLAPTSCPSSEAQKKCPPKTAGILLPVAKNLFLGPALNMLVARGNDFVEHRINIHILRGFEGTGGGRGITIDVHYSVVLG